MIVWRDHHRSGCHVPPSLVGAHQVTRVELPTGGALLTVHNPLLLSADLDWQELDEDWSIARRTEDGDHHHLARAVTFPTVLVTDRLGQPWSVPAILTPDGALAHPVPVAIVGHEPQGGVPTPVWGRRPTPRQAQWIAAAEAARAELVAGRYQQVPLSAAATWTATLLGATYHLSALELSVLGLLDDALLARVPAAAAGLVLPE